MERRFVPPRVHAVVDYVAGPALVAAPAVLRLDGAKGSSLTPRVVGAGTTALSAFSNHPLAAKRFVPMRLHLVADAAAGTMLAAGPWATGSARRGARHWLPHALVGATEVALALVTRSSETPAPVSRTRRLLGSPWARAAAPAVAASALGVVAWKTDALSRLTGGGGGPTTPEAELPPAMPEAEPPPTTPEADPTPA